MRELISELKSQNIYLSVDQDELVVDFDGDSLPGDLISKIKSNKFLLIEFLRKYNNKPAYTEIPPAIPNKCYPVSSGQLRLWVLSQFENGSVVYNMPNSIYLNQEINIDSFKKAIAATIERHEILRTVFKEDETGEIRQWVLNSKDLGFTIDYKDLRKAKNKEEQVRAYIKEDAYKAFDLAKGPLLRATLLQVEDEAYVFYYNMHHIISDGWSMGVLSKDVLAYYEAYENNQKAQLKELRIQYKDYSAWQLAQLEEESFKAHKAYWLNSLAGELPLLDLPGTKQRPRIKTNNGHGLSAYIDEATTTKLKKYSEANGGSLFMGLLAAWNILMYRYTSQSDIITGTPTAGREHADLEEQIGFYVNTLALRNEIKPENNFDELFSSVKQNTLNAYSHQIYPFDRLVEELELQRDTSRSAVFDILFALQNNGEKLDGAALKKEDLNKITDLGFSTSKFDLEIAVKETSDYLLLQVVYNSDVYEKDLVEALISHYQQLLNQILENPQAKISQIDYLSQDERQELLIAFNDTTTEYPKDKTIAALFEEQAIKTPNEITVVFEDTQLTYKELDEQSNQLAHYLQKNYQIQPEDLIGIKLERSAWMIISILGVLKSGGAYVPIDPEYPQERINYIEEDTNCKICIDEAELNKFKTNQTKCSTKKVISKATANNLAYIMYTSGSTGRPKGVMVEQKSVVRLVKNTNFIQVAQSDKILGLSNFSFDGSTFDIFMPLLNGGGLVISSKDIFLNLQVFNKIIDEQAIASFFLTTVLFNSLVDAELPALGKLKYILFGGEQVSVSHVNKFKTLYPKVNIHHVYGPTENTTFSTWYAINNVAASAFTIPIGSGISNSITYILDGHSGIVPKGVTGEIYVGGDGLAKGYLNQEELSKEKFISNPFKAGEKIYKTGDLGRWTKDGNIEFIGRKDNQVKIRGHRIELGEIEHALQSHKAIEEVVVLAKANEQNEKEIVAYIVSKEEQNTTALRNYLKETLPEYMLPAYYVQLETLPLNSNGKVDKKLLPDPQGLGLSSGVAYVAPQTDTEEKLVKIWQEVLQRENIGIKDDFFELGGHSLKAARLSNAYQKELSVKLSLKDLFAHTSIESQAALIQSSKKSDFIQIEKVALRAAYPISDAQRRLWVLSQFEESSAAYNIPVSVYLNQDINIESFKKAIDATIERHEILRTIFKENATGETRQWILKKEDLGFKINYTDFRKLPNKQQLVQSYIREDSYKPFNLEKGPLLRAGLLQVEDAAYVFYYNMHHIISDAWSMEVLSKDVLSYYEAYKNNQQPQLKELRIQYKDYSAWQLAATSALHKSYWKEILAGQLPVFELPFMNKRPPFRNFKGGAWSTCIDPRLSSQLRETCRKNNGTLFHGMLAAWQVLMYKYSGNKDQVIGTSVAGRNHPDLQDQIGFYSNSIALRNEMDPNKNFIEILKTVIENANNAMAHQDYPFIQVVADLEMKRESNRNPVFDAMFVFNNKEDLMDPAARENIDYDEMSHADSTAKFDLEISIVDLGSIQSLSIIYDADIFDALKVKNMVVNYKYLLNELLNNLSTEISDIKIEDQALRELKKLNLSKLTAKKTV